MAKLTYGQRKNLGKSQFVFPSKRTYPIDTANRGRNALARVSQFGSPSEKAAVGAAVHRRYPTIGKGRKAPENMETPKKIKTERMLGWPAYTPASEKSASAKKKRRLIDYGKK